MTTPIKLEGPYCYGVCCHDHSVCLRYTALDGSTDDRPRIDNCGSDQSQFMPEAPNAS